MNALSGFFTTPTQLAMANRRDGHKLCRERYMKAREVMHKGVRVIGDNDTLEKAAALMRKTDVGILPVVHASKVVGVLTDRDIVTRCLALAKDARRVLVRECMSKDLVWVPVDAELEEICEKMSQKKISRVLVEDVLSRPVGVISVEDFAHHCDPALFAKTISAIKS